LPNVAPFRPPTTGLLSLHSDDKFAVLCRAAFDGVVVHDGGRIVEANEKFAQMFDSEVADVLGRNIADFTAPEMRAIVGEHCAAQTSVAFESIALRRNGEPFPVEFCGISVAGTTLRVIAVRDRSEECRIEQSEHRRQERMRSLAHVAFDGICVDKEGVIVEANESFAKMTGYDTAEMIGMAIEDIVPRWQVSATRGSASESSQYETQCRRKDATSFPIEVCGAALPAGERVIAIRDISRRREAEDALRVSEDRFRDLVENSNDVIGAHDLDGIILLANAAAGKALNVESDKLRNVLGHIKDGGAGKFNDYLGALRRDGAASGTVAVDTDGHRKLWEYRSSLRTDGVSAPVARVLARDVTEREESLATARNSEQHFRSIIENSSDLIAIIGTDGTLGYQSPSIERVLGVTAQSVVGKRFVDLVHPESVRKASDFLARQLAHPGTETMVELRFEHESGSWRSFEVIGRSVVAGGVVTAIVTNARDITDRQMLESQLAQANRLSSLGRLAATVAHEFNNVLMGMQPFAELMQRPNATRSTISKGAWHISNSIHRGKRIVLDILRFTQPAQPATALVDVARWWASFAPEAETIVGNSVTIISTLNEPGLCVVADEQQLSQVMANLIANARDAMSSGGTLTVAAFQPAAQALFAFGVVQNAERFLQVSVTDSGHGMAPEVLERIFEPLFTTKKRGGTGLGLAVAHQVLTQHGGYIFAESEIGTGTSFHLFIPKGTAACENKSETAAQSERTHDLTVLMIEDEEVIVEGVSALLRAEGFAVNVARTGAEASAAVDACHPDVVLLDFGLPDMDGLEVHAIIRESHPLMPVIFASGHADHRATATDSHVRFLQKPFDFAALLSMIAELCPKAFEK